MTPAAQQRVVRNHPKNGHAWALMSLALFSFLFTTAHAQSQLLMNYADLVLHNGQILTVDSDFTVAEAIAVRDGRVLATGSSREMLALAGPGTTRVDLKGRTVTPGYIYNDGDNAVPGGDIYKDTLVDGWLSGSGNRQRPPPDFESCHLPITAV